MAKHMGRSAVAMTIRDLEAQREKIDEALDVLYGLGSVTGNGAGRPRRVTRKSAFFTPRRKGRVWTAAQRKAASVRMKSRLRLLKKKANAA